MNTGEISPDIDFIYHDTDNYEIEIQELYSYSESSEFSQNLQSFQNLINAKFSNKKLQTSQPPPLSTSTTSSNLPLKWRQLTESQRKDTINTIVDQFDSGRVEVRRNALHSLLYLLQGCWAECRHEREQVLWSARNTVYLVRLGLFPNLVQLLMLEIHCDDWQLNGSSASSSQNRPADMNKQNLLDSRDLRVILNCLYICVETCRAITSSDKHNTQHEAFSKISKADIQLIKEFITELCESVTKRSTLLRPLPPSSSSLAAAAAATNQSSANQQLSCAASAEPNLIEILFGMIHRFCSGQASNFPMKKTLLLLWKLILVILGPFTELFDKKNAARLAHGLPLLRENSHLVISSMHSCEPPALGADFLENSGGGVASVGGGAGGAAGAVGGATNDAASTSSSSLDAAAGSDSASSSINNGGNNGGGGGPGGAAAVSTSNTSSSSRAAARAGRLLASAGGGQGPKQGSLMMLGRRKKMMLEEALLSRSSPSSAATSSGKTRQMVEAMRRMKFQQQQQKQQQKEQRHKAQLEKQSDSKENQHKTGEEEKEGASSEPHDKVVRSSCIDEDLETDRSEILAGRNSSELMTGSASVSNSNSNSTDSEEELSTTKIYLADEDEEEDDDDDNDMDEEEEEEEESDDTILDKLEKIEATQKSKNKKMPVATADQEEDEEEEEEDEEENDDDDEEEEERILSAFDQLEMDNAAGGSVRTTDTAHPETGGLGTPRPRSPNDELSTSETLKQGHSSSVSSTSSASDSLSSDEDDLAGSQQQTHSRCSTLSTNSTLFGDEEMLLKFLPWRPKVKQKDLEAFMQDVRNKFIGFKPALSHDTITLAGLPFPIQDAIRVLKAHIYVSLGEHQIEMEQRICVYPMSFGKLESLATASTALPANSAAVSNKSASEAGQSEADGWKMAPAEALYQTLLPNLQQYMIALLKILLSAAPTSKPKSESINILAEVIPSEMPVNAEGSVQLNCDVDRQKEIITKAISAILLLLLKHFKLNHIYQFECVSHSLVFANCIPLVLKFFNQNILAYVQSRNTIKTLLFPNFLLRRPGRKRRSSCVLRVSVEPHEESGTAAIDNTTSSNADTTNSETERRHSEETDDNDDEEEEDEEEDHHHHHQQQQQREQNDENDAIAAATAGSAVDTPQYSWRNLFTSINLLRVLNMLTKGKHSRTMMLVVFKSGPILKKVLRVRQARLQLYILKLLKAQARYYGRQWRKSNMAVMSAIYRQVRHRLTDDWAFGNDVDSRPWDFNNAENELRDSVERFNRRRYAHLLQHLSKQLPAFMSIFGGESGAAGNTGTAGGGSIGGMGRFNADADSMMTAGGARGKFFAEDFRPVDNCYLSVLANPVTLSAEFTENYEQWLEEEVFSEPINWDRVMSVH